MYVGGGMCMTDRIFLWMMVLSLCLSVFSGNGTEMTKALLNAAQQTLETVWSMTGGLMFFSGIMMILQDAGVMEKWAAYITRPLRKLLGSDVSEEGMQYAAMNLTANMLGMGNAATPMGIRAVRCMAKGEEITCAMCMFLVINTSSVQLLPTTLISMRAALGAAEPTNIVLPALIASTVSTASGILACKVMEKLGGGKAGKKG